MSIKGGYKVLDVSGKTFTQGVGTKIDGIYKFITANTKATLVSGLVFGGKKYDDVFVNFMPNNDIYTAVVPIAVDNGQLNTLTFKIMSTDFMTISAENAG